MGSAMVTCLPFSRYWVASYLREWFSEGIDALVYFFFPEKLLHVDLAQLDNNNWEIYVSFSLPEENVIYLITLPFTSYFYVARWITMKEILFPVVTSKYALGLR